jgi:tetratricopeptide (TPR) repeat protein
MRGGRDAITVYTGLATYYLDQIECAALDSVFEHFEQVVFPHCAAAFSYLSRTENGTHGTHAVLARLLRTLFPLVMRRGSQEFLKKFLFEWCKTCLENCLADKQDCVWIYLLRYELYFAQGKWDLAWQDIEYLEAIVPRSSSKSGQVLYARGRLEFNQGAYQNGLQHLRQAQQLLQQQGDLQRSIQVTAEEAAYLMNAGHLRRALKVYEQVEAMRREVNVPLLEDHAHTLLMLGVIHRKLHYFGVAEQYFNVLLTFLETNQLAGSIATALHHLAWVYLNQGRFEDAERCCQASLQRYTEMYDGRGLGDAYEQAGMIQYRQLQTGAALDLLEKALQLRLSMGNRQGAANNLKCLAQVHLAAGHFQQGLGYFAQSITLYRELRILTIPRAMKLASDLIHAFALIAVHKRKRYK